MQQAPAPASKKCCLQSSHPPAWITHSASGRPASRCKATMESNSQGYIFLAKEQSSGRIHYGRSSSPARSWCHYWRAATGTSNTLAGVPVVRMRHQALVRGSRVLHAAPHGCIRALLVHQQHKAIGRAKSHTWQRARGAHTPQCPGVTGLARCLRACRLPTCPPARSDGHSRARMPAHRRHEHSRRGLS